MEESNENGHIAKHAKNFTSGLYNTVVSLLCSSLCNCINNLLRQTTFIEDLRRILNAKGDRNSKIEYLKRLLSKYTNLSSDKNDPCQGSFILVMLHTRQILNGLYDLLRDCTGNQVKSNYSKTNIMLYESDIKKKFSNVIYEILCLFEREGGIFETPESKKQRLEKEFETTRTRLENINKTLEKALPDSNEIKSEEKNDDHCDLDKLSKKVDNNLQKYMEIHNRLKVSYKELKKETKDTAKGIKEITKTNIELYVKNGELVDKNNGLKEEIDVLSKRLKD